MRKSWPYIGLFCLLNILSIQLAYGIEKTEEEIKAQFIINYITYTKWPVDGKKHADPITICVMADDLTALYLQKMNNNPDKKFTLEVKEKEKRGAFSECHILYINQNFKSDRDYFIKITHGTPILTISDIPGFAEYGGIAEFQIDKGKVVLYLNMHSAIAANIKIDPDLIGVMTKVY